MAMVELGSPATVHPGVTLNIEKEDVKDAKPSSSTFTREYSQKLIAELVATYFLVFAGCGAIMVDIDKNKLLGCGAIMVDIDKNKLLGQPGVAITWGAAVMVMVYTVGHVSGAHINPAVTIAFASCKRFPWKEVPGYMVAQVLAAILASGTLRLIFSAKHDNFAGSAPPGSDFQALVVEIIITFYLMFVISAVATDDRATGQLAGVVIGTTVLLNAMFAGPISGASMNPARSIGPALVWNKYEGLWIYIFGPTIGALGGAWAYNTMRLTEKGSSDITKGAPQH
ncbi:major intrinsic protein, Aquaporin-like protein [Artemisia annua]|uniref:Major intrinsic protein, Aquaporin-like protein n=1 Tax=Artemisia annua TaxID=35608 RepID=A0A2U1QJS6_ARTAN|nr:major intrinsic protein, Aquaporin-like protein [Artemisia annua]